MQEPHKICSLQTAVITAALVGALVGGVAGGTAGFFVSEIGAGFLIHRRRARKTPQMTRLDEFPHFQLFLPPEDNFLTFPKTGEYLNETALIFYT